LIYTSLQASDILILETRMKKVCGATKKQIAPNLGVKSMWYRYNMVKACDDIDVYFAVAPRLWTIRGILRTLADHRKSHQGDVH
jgi:hypothetical protein